MSGTTGASSLPGPPPAPADAVTEAFWQATREGTLSVQHCPACGGHQHPPRVLCVHCGGIDGLRQVPVRGAAVLDSFTTVHRAPDGRAVPYTVGRVRLAEGPVLLVPVLGDPDSFRCDQPVRLVWLPLPDGRRQPAFTPAPDAAPDEPEP
ncbi:Zn-ribbon domain-containing OB-fold protein [Streptomyces sp. NPDC050529]|uniref:Zn-ribbon domain-containing OB-fold protein n=1 Tax=unclassified Streptomyces TaxID=2593676 RepID=UPI002DD95303|nr:OB-fold domain-containing protein [Streptomyces sp. NBC_01022]WRZ78832.1 OB-fold domain-containing protein [Streptomyces sp. NBC_01022]WRZ86847.1 OB-fold domain-containing protein [Streptomyces sp. NBC_01022]